MPALGLPAKQKTWTITPNNRIAFVSLNDTMSKYLFGVKAFLKAHGYTVAGSSNGSTGGTAGAPDGVDRWTTSANATTRGAAAGNAQSWVILTDGSGVQILITYQGGSDDIARLSFSPTAAFSVAATTQNQPTAADEQVFSTLTLINSTANLDRNWFGWVDSQSKLCRFGIARNQVFVGQMWGVDLVSSVVTGTGTTWSPAVWGFALPAVTDTFSSASFTTGKARPTVSSSPVSVNCLWAVEQFGGAGTHIAITNSKAEFQGAIGFPVIPIGIGSSTASAQGKLGNLFDMWSGRGNTGGADGDTYGNKAFIGVAGFRGNTGSLLWPWDGATTPVLY
jgi:hypothetical protein